MTLSIRQASSDADYAAFGELCRTYVDWCRARYAHDTWFVTEVFGYQSLDDELKDLSLKYGPPKGRTYLAIQEGVVAGGGAYRRTSETTCELKRLYVSDTAKGQGVGRRLSEALMQAAREDGFTRMQLDTGNLLTEAIAMYEKLGFERCPPYHSYPERLMPYLVFMQRALA